jgi:hypothetical protein
VDAQNYKGDGTPYYEYMLVYTDDLFAISENPQDMLQQVAGQVLSYETKVNRETRYIPWREGNFNQVSQ